MNHHGDGDCPNEEYSSEESDQPDADADEAEEGQASRDESLRNNVGDPQKESQRDTPEAAPEQPDEVADRIVRRFQGWDFSPQLGLDRINALIQPPRDLFRAPVILDSFDPFINHHAWYEAITPSIAPAASFSATRDTNIFGRRMANLWRTEFADLITQYLPDFSGVVENLERLQELHLPPNWRNEEIDIPENLDDLVLKEALPLAWVPDSETLRQVFQAQTPDARREVLLQRQETVIGSCQDVLATVEGETESEWAEFASFAAGSLAEGDYQVSQALSANVLDTAMQALLPDHNERSYLTSENLRAQTLRELDMGYRTGLALGAAGASYIKFYVKDGDEIPNDFSRHATAHAVSRRQYTPLNALLALMHATAVVKTIDAELREDEDRPSEAAPDSE